MEKPEDRERTLRKYNSNLITCGKGVLIIGFWAAIKTVITMLLNAAQYQDMLGEDVPKWVVRIFLFFMILIFGGASLLFHMWIGTSAIAVGKYDKKKKVWLVVAVIYLFFTINGLPGYFMTDDDEAVNNTQNTVSKSGVSEDDMGLDIPYDNSMAKDRFDDSMQDGIFDDEDDEDDPFWSEPETEKDRSEDERKEAGASEYSVSGSFVFDSDKIYNNNYDTSIVAFVGDMMLTKILIDMIVTAFLRKRLIDTIQKETA